MLKCSFYTRLEIIYFVVLSCQLFDRLYLSRYIRGTKIVRHFESVAMPDPAAGTVREQSYPLKSHRSLLLCQSLGQCGRRRFANYLNLLPQPRRPRNHDFPHPVATSDPTILSGLHPSNATYSITTSLV